MLDDRNELIVSEKKNFITSIKKTSQSYQELIIL